MTMDIPALVEGLEVLKVEPGDRWIIRPQREMSLEQLEQLAEAVADLGRRWGIEIVVLDKDVDLTVVRE